MLLVNRRYRRASSPAPPTGWRSSTRSRTTSHRQHDQGGWSQKRFQRGIEQEKLNHLGNTLDVLFKRFKRQPFDHLVVGAPEELVARRSRSGCTRTCASGSRAGSASTSRTRRSPRSRPRPPRSSTGTSRPSSARRSTASSRGSGAATAASAGPKAVMKALEEARVEILLLADDFDVPAARRGGREGDHPVGAGARDPPPRRPRDARRHRRRAALLAWLARSSSSTSRTTSRPAARSACPTATRSPSGSTRWRAPAASTSWWPRATGTRPTTARSPRRAGRGRRTASRARPAPSCTRRSTARSFNVVVDKGQAPATRATRASRRPGWRRCCASATSTT